MIQNLVLGFPGILTLRPSINRWSFDRLHRPCVLHMGCFDDQKIEAPALPKFQIFRKRTKKSTKASSVNSLLKGVYL